MADEHKVIASSSGNRFIERLHEILSQITGLWMIFKYDESTLEQILLMLDRLYVELEAFLDDEERKEAVELLRKINEMDRVFGKRMYFSRTYNYCIDTNKLNIKITLLKSLELLLRRVMRKNKLMIDEKEVGGRLR